MVMDLEQERLDGLVSMERGEVDRRIFSDPEIFEREMTEIFGRAWLFLCHVSQIPKAGDFFEAPMGRDNVLVVRQKDKSVKGLLNTCAHRGNAVCRAEEGNVKNFMCTYHGWTYDLSGKLVGVPGLAEFYNGDLDLEAHGLGEVAQLDTYKGFVFATLDAGAPPLVDYLGPTGRLGIDLIAEKGDDMQVVPGVQKFFIECNWKLAVDNLCDWYHPQITHASAFTRGILPGPAPKPASAVELGDNERTDMDMTGVHMADGGALDLAQSSISGTVVDQIVVLGEYGHAISGPDTRSELANVAFDQSWRERPAAQEALGPVGLTVAGHPGIFPTTWIATSSDQLCLRIPRGPKLTEIWWFTFVDRAADEATQKRTITNAIHVFGPAGLLEQEDGENWAQATETSVGIASRRMRQVLSMNLGRGKIVKEHHLARIDCTTNEHGQLWNYGAWAHWMAGETWDQIKASTTPGDYL